MEIEQEGADAVAAHRADAVGDDQPAGLRLDGRAAVADLHELPRLCGPQQLLRVFPVVHVVGKHEVEVLVVLSRDHRVAAVDAAGEERHAFVFHGAPVEREHAEVLEIARLDELRQDDAAVVCRVGRVIDDAPVVLDEADEAGVLDAVRFIRGDRKDDALGHRELRQEADLVVRFRKPAHTLQGALLLAHDDASATGDRFHAHLDLGEGECLAERLQHSIRGMIVEAHLVQFHVEGVLVVARVHEHIRRGDVGRYRIHGDLVAPVDHAGAKFDGRDVPFAGGAQAHDEAERIRREPALIWMRDDRGVEERGGFERVFAGEQGADEELARAAERPVRRDMRLDAREDPQERLLDIDMARAEVVHDHVEFALGLLFAERKRAAYDAHHALRDRWDEGTDKNARTVGLDLQFVAMDGNGAHGVCRG